jgi:hypothetical protein
LPPHQAEGRAGAEEHAGDVGLAQPQPVVDRDLVDGLAGQRDAGVVEQEVQPAPGGRSTAAKAASTSAGSPTSAVRISAPGAPAAVSTSGASRRPEKCHLPARRQKARAVARPMPARRR